MNKKPGGLQSMGSQRTGHNWKATKHARMAIKITKATIIFCCVLICARQYIICFIYIIWFYIYFSHLVCEANITILLEIGLEMNKANWKWSTGDGKSELWHFRNQRTKMGEFNSDDHYIYYRGQESLRRNGVAITVNKSEKCSTWLQSQKWQNDLCPFLRQTIQYHSNLCLCPSQLF